MLNASNKTTTVNKWCSTRSVSGREVPEVEMWLESTLDNHINIALVTFVLHLLPTTLTAIANAYSSS